MSAASLSLYTVIVTATPKPGCCRRQAKGPAVPVLQDIFVQAWELCIPARVLLGIIVRWVQLTLRHVLLAQSVQVCVLEKWNSASRVLLASTAKDSAILSQPDRVRP